MKSIAKKNEAHILHGKKAPQYCWNISIIEKIYFQFIIDFGVANREPLFEF